jgi:hypothetical protein
MTDPHDAIDDALRGTPYLDDGSFTDGVMKKLPPRAPRRRGAVLALAGVAAGLLGAAMLGEPLTAAAVLLSASSVTGLLLGGAVLVATAGVLLRTARH